MERPTPFAAVDSHCGCEPNRGLPPDTTQLHANEPGYHMSNPAKVHDTQLQQSGSVRGRRPIHGANCADRELGRGGDAAAEKSCGAAAWCKSWL